MDTLPTNPNKDKTNDSDAVDDRTLIEGLLRPNDVVRLGLVLYAIGTIAFLLLTHFSPAKEPYLALIFFGALPLSFLYTGGIGKIFLFELFHFIVSYHQVSNTSLSVMSLSFSPSVQSPSFILTWHKPVITVSIPSSTLYH